MADISVSTTQSVIEVTQTSGISVTVPTGQTIDVAVPNSSVNVTNTTDDITILTAGTLNITTGITDRLVAGSNQVILNTNATMTFPNNVIDFGSQTADLKSSSYSELWYRNATATPPPGQGIQTYIWAWENQAGIAVESVDNGYKEWYFNANGTTQFPGYTFPAADGTANQILKTNGSGILSWYSPTDANTTYTQNISSTTGGANLNLVGSDSTTDTVKFASGTGVTVAYTDASTATISIGQSVATTDDVTFSSVVVDGVATLNTATTTTTSLTPTNISSTTRTAQKVVVTIKDNVTGEIHTLEALAFMKGTTAYLTTYAEMYSNLALATFTADVDAGTVRILATPASTNSTTFKVARISVD